MINISSQRECFFDDYLIDNAKTTAEFRLHEPTRREIAINHDASWEGNGCNYHNILHDNGIYKMYYLAWQMYSPDNKDHTTNGIRVCYAESRDGITWTKPALGICEWEGSRENNIILDKNTNNFDNFMVFRDDNPAVPASERYKGVGKYNNPEFGQRIELRMFTSPDGLHFTMGDIITTKGYMDSLNVVFWDELAGIYRGYIRGFHNIIGDDWNAGIRDIRYIWSEDGKTWSDPELICFGDSEDYPLYTNCVSPYVRAPHMYIGFPSRYVERHEWNGNFEQLGGKEKRLERILPSKNHKRYGLAVTDCVFMASRDGINFTRYDEAFMRPGMENGSNWVYGDCFPARGLIETPPLVKGEPHELSLYSFDNHWMDVPAQLWRYTIRCDGFVSLHAGYAEKVITTKPFTFTSGEMRINFSTSARGYMYFTLQSSTGETIESCEIFGDAIDRVITFDNGELAQFADKEVVLTVRMRDADLYSIRFA
ncbi:hypothetical protein DQG23_28230 [Paenibacillus contaminans]|uniref:Uncharacterized protein n=2 Tax=Paenibacillus contaminans TaxID=450362 RepID=A0A329M9Q1_9BACL|nr:hypothetical protein DQG23_28230 [Paenibacillus contaminans]